MITVEKKKLPHGEIPFVKIKDVEIRMTVMKLNENIKTIAKQLKVLQDAVVELQRG